MYPTPRSSRRSLAPGGNSVSVLCYAQKPLLSSQGFPCHPAGVLESSCSLSRSNLIAWFSVRFRLSSHTYELKTKSPGLPPCYPNAGRVTSTLATQKFKYNTFGDDNKSIHVKHCPDSKNTGITLQCQQN